MNNLFIEYKDGIYSYRFRVFNNFNNILIERTNSLDNDKYDLIQIMNNFGEIVFSSNIVEHYIKKMYFKSSKEKVEIIKKALISLISNIGFNTISATIVNKLGYDVSYLAKKLKEKNKLYDNDEYIITESKNGEEEVINILNYNCEYIAKVYFKKDGIKIEKMSNDNINILQIINEYLHLLVNFFVNFILLSLYIII